MSEEMKDEKKPGVHTGHRDRVKKQIAKQGFQHLYDHEVLEILLFYAVPRRDTNPIGHELLERFGSLRGIMEADVESIAEVSGLGMSAAILIKTTMEMSKRYIKASDEPILYYDTLAKVATHAKQLYIGSTREIAYALLFDGKMRLLDEVILGEGCISSTTISIRKLVEAIVRRNATAVILVHNHPDGSLIPTQEDTGATRMLYDFLRKMSVVLLEHLIVSGASAYPIMRGSALYDLQELQVENFKE